MFSNKDLRKLIIPLVIEQLLAVTIGMADTVMVSSCGEAAVSGISLVDSINFLLITLFSSLATGGAVIASQYIGRGDHKSASLAAKQLFYASLALSAVLGVIAVFFRKPVLNMVFGSIEADVMAHAQIYFLLSAISYPFLAVYNAGAALFRSMGDSRTTMLISILMNTINIVGNAILIYGFQMAAAGAATASLVSRAVGAIIITVLLLNPRRIIFYDKLHKPEIHLSMLKSILQIGVPNGLENSIFQIGKILVASIVSGFGTISITANAVAGNLASLQVIPGMALGMVVMGTLPSVPVLMLAAGIVGLFAGPASALLGFFAYDRVPESRRGAAMGALNALFLVVAPAGAFFGSVLVSLMDIGSACLVMTGVWIAVTLFALVARALRDLDVPAPTE